MPVDYRKFLRKPEGGGETCVLPYLGGRSVHAPDRRLRVTDRVAVGWWTFEVQGRHATPKAPADPPELHRRPSVRGHLVEDWLFTAGDAAERVHLLPDDRPPVLSPAVARRWFGGHAIMGELPFEEEAEEAARAALLDDGTLDGIRGVHPSLRGAFGYARLLRTGRARGLEVSVREVLNVAHDVADGRTDSDRVLDELEVRRYTIEPTSTPRRRRRAWPQPSLPHATRDNAEERAAAVLEAAGADLLDVRFAGDRNLEVVFRYLDERFIAVVDWETLHVYDAGICLDGADEMLGLDSLPSVIAEAIGNGELNITRR